MQTNHKTNFRAVPTALLLSALCAMIVTRTACAAPAGVQKGEWNGYEQHNFNVGGRGALLVIPKKPAKGNPWIWRTEFFGIDPQADLALLGKGVHVGYLGVGGLFGAPVALDAMDLYYDFVCEHYKLSAKTVPEGFSRGGLYALNWAIRHPDLVACMYLDAPVCDFKSWPGGGGRTRLSGKDWRDCLNAYGMTDAEARAYQGNPIDNLKPMADAKIPILVVCGDMQDWVVAIESNALLLETRYKALGGDVTLIRKPGAGHRPHSLQDPTPIVDFVLQHTTAEHISPGQWKSLAARKMQAIKKTLADIPVNTKPAQSIVLQQFEAQKTVGDPYGARVRGFVHAPKTTDYDFAIAGDAIAELYLSTDESPQHKALIAFTHQPTGPGNFNQFPSQKSKPLRLEAGKKYFIEVLHKQNSGTGHLAVGWAASEVSTGKVIPGTALSPYPKGARGTITQELWLDPAAWPDRPKP
ncbi:MAG: PA14 domain-containing protein [Verrucomicrobia bacterium]|nr:PA14 domain-containing protein [Verrucomicrobiota bacterium]